MKRGDEVIVTTDKLEDTDIICGDHGIVIDIQNDNYLVDFRSINATLWVKNNEVKLR